MENNNSIAYSESSMVSRALIAVGVVAVLVAAGGTYYFYNNYQVVQRSYSVTIGEICLPQGMNWSIAIANQPIKSSNANGFITFLLKDGSYNLLPFASDATYFGQCDNITISGSNQTIIIDFAAIPQTVTGINVHFNYLGTTSGYFGSSTQAVSGGNYDAGINYTEIITLYSRAILFDHNVSSITTNTPGFSINTISPTLPVTVSPDGSVTITVTLNTPLTQYTGVLDLTINTY
jgi:hypothetical protein